MGFCCLEGFLFLNLLHHLQVTVVQWSAPSGLCVIESDPTQSLCYFRYHAAPLIGTKLQRRSLGSRCDCVVSIESLCNSVLFVCFLFVF